ncbi:MAG: hypothetical protein ACYTGR_10045 [Planctomycetota bacterium]|jgi:hypothetical protein
MTTRNCSMLAAAALLVGTAALADHIPGHNDGDPTFPMPIPGQDTYTGGIMFVTLIGPDAGVVTYDTLFEVTFVSDGATPASDLHLTVGTFRDGVYKEVVVNGSDLGFGSGPGTFTGTLTTDALNGEAEGGLFPFSTVNLEVGAINGQIDGVGYFVDSFITFDVAGENPCPADTDGSGVVDVADLVNVIVNWGCTGHCLGDSNGDEIVDVQDLVEVITAWGACA